ncbi:hypothetical protein OsI_21856 [Oryza sativa Indica Group]|uniref:Uncharacterized protein n=1 Tax=Oryza sativa subsp. indica TaxID=39946 RepID=B8B3F2_ORYSI|nr:hypothetical protein OsI_21856 [Oryza sativa Indica Group]
MDKNPSSSKWRILSSLAAHKSFTQHSVLRLPRELSPCHGVVRRRRAVLLLVVVVLVAGAVAAAADMAGDRAALLALRDASLRGAVPVGTVGNLTALRTLSLRTNAISGGVPADIGGCVQLRSLNLSGNRLAGRLPEGLFSLALLEKVDLSGNRLNGGVSPEFSRLASLTTLNLDRNGFNGTLPGNLMLPKLAQFNVSYNGQLGGAVPASLTGMPASAFLGTALCGGPLAPCANPSPPSPGGSKGVREEEEDRRERCGPHL